MAGLWSRTTMVIKSKYSKLLNRAENPTETLDYSYEQMLEQLQNVKRGVADVVTSKKRIELQQQKLEQNVVKHRTFSSCRNNVRLLGLDRDVYEHHWAR